MSAPVLYRPALPLEHARALTWLYRRSSQTEQQRLVDVTLLQLESGSLSPEGVWVAVQNDQLLGCVLGDVLPGRFGLVWPPQAQEDLIELELLHRVSRQLLDRHACLLIAFLNVDDDAGAARLGQADFRHITRVFYLTHSVRAWLQPPQSSIQFRQCDASDPAFTSTLIETYVDSLDCPELNQARTLHDVLLGYQAEARAPPDWFCLEQAGVPMGVLLLYPNLATGACELTYLGIVPAFRGQGWGRIALDFAELYAEQLGQRSLWLSVDVRNEPAIKLYRRHGFSPFDRREAWFRLPASSTASPN